MMGILPTRQGVTARLHVGGNHPRLAQRVTSATTHAYAICRCIISELHLSFYYRPPTCFTESLDRFLARNITELAHWNGLHSYDDRGPLGRHRVNRFLIFSPHPGGNGFLNVLQRLFLITSLRDTSWKSRTRPVIPSFR